MSKALEERLKKREKREKLEKMESIREMLYSKIKENAELSQNFYTLSKTFKFKRDIERCKVIARHISDVSNAMRSLALRLQGWKDKDLLR